MIEEQIRKAQIQLCYETTLPGQFVTVVNGALVYAFLRSVIDSEMLGGWVAALVAIGALRIVAYVNFRRCADLSANLRKWEIVSLAGAVLAGLLWGSAGIVMFVPDSMPHQVFLSFVIAGMTAGAVTTLSVQLPAAIIFIFLAITPLAYSFVGTVHEFGAPMSLMVVLFMLMMIVASVRFFRNYRNTLAAGLRREAAEKELEQIAYYDPLTGLPNRRLFADHMQRAIAAARRHHTLLAVCYLDLDNFKPVNDRYGHETGDRVLVRAARTLQDSVRGGDIVARWGGDEFALLLTDLKDAEACVNALERLIKTIAVTQNLNGVSYSLSASIGATLGPGDSDDPDTLMRHADHAMYLAKRAGRNGYHIFDPEDDGEHRRRAQARQLLRSALDNDELVLYFQPKVEMGRGVVYGAEALVRWRHPERGILEPGAFLSLWEADESMADLDRWVLKSAIAQLDRWLDQRIRLVLSVNVSAWLLNDANFIGYMQTLLEAYPRTRGMIELEVTETRALDDIARVSEVMALCAPMQVEFALDDFGTGFSSLVHLQRLPAHTLKIDTSFVRAMLESDNDRNLVKGIIGLGDALGKAVVAEGVETVEHGAALLKLGCCYAQGYGIAKPMPAAEFPRWFANYVAPLSWCGRREQRPAVALREVASS